VLAPHLVANRIHLGLGLRVRCALPEAAEGSQMLTSPAGRVAGEVVADRRPELGRRVVIPLGVQRLERGRHHPDYPIFAVVHRHDAADHRGIRAKPAPPQSVAEQQHAPMIRAILVGGERAAEGRPHAQEIEVVPADPHCGKALRLAVGNEGRQPRAHHREALNRAAALPPVQDRREADVRGNAFRIAIADGDEPLGRFVRQRPQQNSIDDAEDSGVGADAERERDEHSRGEPRRVAQHADAVAQVLAERIQHRKTPLVPPGIRDLAAEAELLACGTAGGGIVESLRPMGGFEHLQVEVELLTEVLLVPPEPNRASYPGDPLANAHRNLQTGSNPEFTRVGCEFHGAISYQLSAQAPREIWLTAES
jgi:hypothetical protein